MKKLTTLVILTLFLSPLFTTTAFGMSYEKQVAQKVNQQRSKHGAKALQYSNNLAQMAEDKARDMYNNHYFSHTSPTYGSPFNMMKSYGIRYRTAGENIAKGQRTPSEVMTAWMHSPGHRRNILKAAYNRIGVGYYKSVWVQEFIQSTTPMKQKQNITHKSTQPNTSQHYTVKRGDTLWKVAKRNWITLRQLEIMNPKKSNYNLIYIGEKIRVRANIHTVRSGDIAWNIAKQHGMTLWELKGLNPQDKNLSTLYVGQRLYVR